LGGRHTSLCIILLGVQLGKLEAQCDGKPIKWVD
jgi:hypothetical protein